MSTDHFAEQALPGEVHRDLLRTYARARGGPDWTDSQIEEYIDYLIPTDVADLARTAYTAGRASVLDGTVENVALRDILGSIDNALRSGSYMTGANFAMEMLCDLLEVDRDGLTFAPDWYRRRQAIPVADDHG